MLRIIHRIRLRTGGPTVQFVAANRKFTRAAQDRVQPHNTNRDIGAAASPKIKFMLFQSRIRIVSRARYNAGQSVDSKSNGHIARCTCTGSRHNELIRNHKPVRVPHMIESMRKRDSLRASRGIDTGSSNGWAALLAWAVATRPVLHGIGRKKGERNSSTKLPQPKHR